MWLEATGEGNDIFQGDTVLPLLHGAGRGARVVEMLAKWLCSGTAGGEGAPETLQRHEPQSSGAHAPNARIPPMGREALPARVFMTPLSLAWRFLLAVASPNKESLRTQ